MPSAFPLGMRAGKQIQLLGRVLRLSVDGLAAGLCLLWLISAVGLLDWQRAGQVAGPPWDALLNSALGPRMALLLAGMSLGYAGLRGASLALGRSSVRNVLGSGTITAFRRLVRFAAWLPLVTAGYLLLRVDPALLRANLEVHGDRVSLTLPTLMAAFAFSLAALTLPPRAPKPYLPRPLDQLAGLAVLPVALGIVLSLDQIYRGQAKPGASLFQVVTAQLALLGVEVAYLLAAIEAFLADRADARQMRLQGRVAGALGVGRGLARVALFFGPVVTGLWLAAGAVPPAASLLLDREGRLLRYYYPSGVYSIPVSAADISSSMKLALEAIEDPGLYASPLAHIPLNPVRLAGVFTAAAHALDGDGESDLSGGSGIAVQGCKQFAGRPLARMALGLPDWLPFHRNLAMIATLGDKLAFEFPCGWTFERTSMWLGADRSSLTFYLNAVYFGRGAYGVQAASLTYFGKPAKDLGPTEAALLAGLPQAPSALDPWRNPEGVRARRSQVLKAMVREGYLEPGVAAAMDVAPLGVLPEPQYPKSYVPGLDLFTRYLMEWLDVHGYRDLSTGGYRVTLSLDPARQRELERDVAGAVSRLATRRVNNGGAVVLDPRTGEILAWFGGLQPAEGPDALPDMVAGFPHQPGSALKPLLYACALEEGMLHPEELLDDTPRIIGGRAVANWDLDPRGRGLRPAAEELAESRNTAAAELVERLTPQGFAACLRDRFHVRTDLHPEEQGVELGLGLAEMPLLELAAAYTVLANGGVYSEPTPVRGIQGRDGRDLYRAHPVRGPGLVSEDSVGWVFDALTAVSRKLGISGGVATKTGTTPSSSFVVGYRGDLLLAAWLGRTEPGQGRMEIDDVEGQDAAWALWRTEAAGQY